MKTIFLIVLLIGCSVTLPGCGLQRMAEGINNEDGHNLPKPSPTPAPKP